MAFQKGQVANPGGRPRAVQGASARLSRAIAEATRDGDELYEILLKIARRKGADITEESPQWARIRLEAVSMLLDRLAGKPQQQIEVRDESDPVGALLDALSPRARAVLDRELGIDDDDGAIAAVVAGLQ